MKILDERELKKTTATTIKKTKTEKSKGEQKLQ